MSEQETRVLGKAELRISGSRRARKLTGHAAVFNSFSEDLGGFREVIAPGAFSESIKKDDVRALFNHDTNFVLGRNRSGTLRLHEDSRGLAIEVDLLDTQTVNDLVVAPIERGDITGMSFGFSVRRPGGDWWDKDSSGGVVRTLKRVRLFDVSPVTMPAYPATDVAMRGFKAWRAAHPIAPSRRTLAELLEQDARLQRECELSSLGYRLAEIDAQ